MIGTALRFQLVLYSLLFWGLLLMPAIESVAQQPGVVQPEPPKPQPLTLTGRIHSFNAKQINVVSSDNQPWQVAIKKNTHIRLTGNAGPAGLRPRAPIRFHAFVNQRGQATEPVAEVTLFTPHEGFAPLVELAPLEETEGDAEQATTKQATTKQESDEQESDESEGNANVDDEQQTEANEQPRSRRARLRDRNGSEQSQRYFVSGLLSSVKRGKFVVNVGDLGMVKGELADELIAKVEYDNHAAAKPGDHIEVRGRFTTPGLLNADNIEITLEPPPVEEKKSKRQRAKDRRNKDDKAEEKETPDTHAENDQAEPADGDQ